MNYKDKFNAQMKKAGINSLDDLKTDAEKKAFFKAVDKSHDAKNEELLAFAEEAINEFKLKDSDVEKLKQGVKQMPPLKGAKLGKPQKVKTADEDLEEEMKDLEPDAKEINAMYKENKYLPTKDGSINDAVAQMQMAEQKTVTVRVKEFSQMVETYLTRGGVKGFINAELTEGKQVLPLKEVRTFIDTYNRHFLTNYKAEEFIIRDRLEG